MYSNLKKVSMVPYIECMSEDKHLMVPYIECVNASISPWYYLRITNNGDIKKAEENDDDTSDIDENYLHIDGPDRMMEDKRKWKFYFE